MNPRPCYRCPRDRAQRAISCTSSAWVLNYFTDHACILAHFPEEAQHEVWGRDKTACIATSPAPTGKVSVAAGG